MPLVTQLCIAPVGFMELLAAMANYCTLLLLPAKSTAAG